MRRREVKLEIFTRMKREGKGDIRTVSKFLFAYLLGMDTTHCSTEGARVIGLRGQIIT